MRYGAKASSACIALGVLAILLMLAPPALAVPFHPREEARDVTGLNHACGAAVDSKGDLYLSSAGANEVKVYDPSHKFLTSIEDTSQPCGLAVTTTGALYVSERGTGEVVRFKPSAYPFIGAPTYGAREVIDASGQARGIATDPFDSRLYVAEGNRISVYEADGSSSGVHIGEGTLTEASGVSAYTYPTANSGTDRYLWVADAHGVAADRLYLFAGPEFKALTLRRELSGATTPAGSFGFGAAGAYLAADPGNRSSEGKCPAVGEQACTAGHLFLYDAAHKALDEFDASGEYLDQTRNAAFADAEPTAVAIDRSGTSGDGTLYVTVGAGAGAKALAFGPLKQPTRATLSEPISKILTAANSVATDSHGYVYAAAGTLIHVYKPDGTEVKTLESKALIEDKHKPWDLAVDSTGKVYVLDENKGFSSEAEVTYYTPSAYPPVTGTTYTRHEPALVTPEAFPAGAKILKAIAVNPGPSAAKDRLYVTTFSVTHIYKSAANGSELLNGEFAKAISAGIRQSLAVDGARGVVYIGTNPSLIYGVNEATEEIRSRIRNSCRPDGKIGSNPYVAVDQADGHLLTFDGQTSTAHEYDAAGSCVAESGTFTEGLVRPYRVAVDSACTIHEPPLTGKVCEEFDPANGNAYVAFDGSNPFDVSAFGPLTYSAPSKHKLTVKKTGSGSGTVTSSPAGINCGSECSHEYEETEVVTLTATAGAHSEFVKWTGCEAEPSATECEVTISKDREIVAEFEKEVGTEYPLTVKKTGAGEASVISSPEGVDCNLACEEESAKFVEGTEVVLMAEAPQGSELLGWTGCQTKTVSAHEGTCTVTMDEPRTVEVELGIEHPELTVKVEGPGTVTSSPAGIECPVTCSGEFELGEDITLTAKPESSEFEVWTGCDAEPSLTECEVTMNEPRQVTATFIPLPQVKVEHPHPVFYTEATLRGEVDTAELATEYRFEYLTEQEYEDNGETFENAKTTSTGELDAGKGFVAVEAPLFGLKEGTKYRFLLHAMNSRGSAEDEGVFETLQRRVSPSCSNAAYRIGFSAHLPDCRAYELVTPAETNGAGVLAPISDGFNNWLTVPRGARAGEAFSFETSATLPGFEGSGVVDGYRSERSLGAHPEEGWNTELLSPSFVQGGGNPSGAGARGVSEDQLYSFWVVNPAQSFKGGLPAGSYLRTPAGFEVVGQGSTGTDLKATAQYVSSEGSHVIFSSTAHLEGKAAPEGTETIYDRKAGTPSAEVVSVKPNGSAFASGEDAVYLGATEDGSGVAFKVGGVLYLHRNGVTFEIVAKGNTFEGISSDGTRVFYVDKAFDFHSNPPPPAGFFVCDLEEGNCAGLEQDHEPTEIADESTPVDVSPDGSHAFFTSTEMLTGGEENDNGEKAEEGNDNLYAWDDAGIHFIAVLDSQDLISFDKNSETHLGVWNRAILAGSERGFSDSPARSTPKGQVFVFQSHAKLSAYDNDGAGEIYRYAPGAPSSERLICVSCDPTGAAPGGDDAVLASPPFPAGTEQKSTSGVSEKTVISNVTDDGDVVFFQSPDRLLPEDANETVDVYEWRAKGSGDPACSRSGGCLALISSGQGESPSFLYAMSADGHDVFFKTQEELVGSDVPGSPSIYDAREEGGIPETTESAPCQGDACQGQGSEAPVLPAPATSGLGESPEVSTPPRPCAKGRHRVKGRCVKRHARKHHRRAGRRSQGGHR